MLPEAKKEIITRLQSNILQWQGCKSPAIGGKSSIGLRDIENAFPNGVFPKAAIHEFLTFEPENVAASCAFICGILKNLMTAHGACLWITTSGAVFPPALQRFGIEPHRVIFVRLQRVKDILWAAEEGLKCEGLAAVIAEVPDVNAVASRRLQLAVETSRVTGFLLRTNPRRLSVNTCAARWKITPLASRTPGDLPGIGYPRWQIELLKVRNGNPGIWKVEWINGGFTIADDLSLVQGAAERDNVIRFPSRMTG